jgi:hypothetical protein
MEHTQQAYDRMVEDIKQRTGADEEPSILEEIANHGADAGWSGFTYTNDCVEFYEAHKEIIWQMLREDANSMGYNNVIAMVATFSRSDMLDDEDSFKNLLAWYALEEVAGRYARD